MQYGGLEIGEENWAKVCRYATCGFGRKTKVGRKATPAQVRRKYTQSYDLICPYCESQCRGKPALYWDMWRIACA